MLLVAVFVLFGVVSSLYVVGCCSLFVVVV